VLNSQTLFSLILISATVFCPVVASAQAQVRDSSVTPSVPSTNQAVNNGVVYELQGLQQEVQALRGLVEEQAYELKRLKQQRLDDYLDLDKRVSELVRQQSSMANPTASVTPSTVSPTVGLPAIARPTELNPNSEQANGLYNEAIDLLLNKQDYDGAQAKFAQYLEKYPNGQYVPNVYYWQGQIFFVGAKKQEAASAFEKLIAQYPTHLKAPDAKFKLARIYFEQGKKAEAKLLLDEVAAGGSDVAPLAQSFISKNY
jgi:tol-pal system protein YbgF